MNQLSTTGMDEIAQANTSENNGLNVPPPEDFNTYAMQGSFQQVLSENLGQYVVVEFLIGTQSMQQKSGILYAVGRSFLTLFEETSQTFVVCDMFSVKFVTFYLPGRRPQRFAGPGTTGSGMPYPASAFGPVTQGPGGGVTFSGLPNMGSADVMGRGNGMGSNMGNNMMGNGMGMGNGNGFSGIR